MGARNMTVRRIFLSVLVVPLLILSAVCAAPANAPLVSAVAAPPQQQTKSAANLEALTASFARLTQSNQELLDLLKKQQAVLEDIQYDRRLQNRQISSLEERLEETMQQNGQLQAKIATLEAQIAVTPAGSMPSVAMAGAGKNLPAVQSSGADSAPPPAAPPATYLPAPESEGAPGTKSWHRLFTLSGSIEKTSNPFHITGPQWRVLWHNQDRSGAAYVNTSALFINAFRKNDSVPLKVCSKLGSGGDAAELDGPGTFSLKVEASGGAWELAVEDFR